MRRAKSAGTLHADAGVRARPLRTAGTPSRSHQTHHQPVGMKERRRECQTKSSRCSSATRSSAGVQEVGTPLVLRLCHAIALLVQEPLQQLHRTLYNNEADEDIAIANSLHPLLDFLQRAMASLQDVRAVLINDGVVGGRQALQQLIDGREDLTYCAQCAGKALRGLATSANLGSVSLQLRTLQDSLSETLDGVRRGSTEREAEERRCAEVAQLHAELREARDEAAGLSEKTAAERQHWCRALRDCMQSCRDERSSDECSPWDRVLEEVACGRANVDHLAPHIDNFRHQAARKAVHISEQEQEVKGLRGRVDAAAIELRFVEDRAEAERAEAVAERRLSEAARAELLKELGEERARREELANAAKRSEESEERALSQLAQQLSQERRERAALSMQLNEAMETVAGRDRVIEGLRQSHTEEMDRARRPPIAVPPPHGWSSGAGPVPRTALHETNSPFEPLARAAGHAPEAPVHEASPREWLSKVNLLMPPALQGGTVAPHPDGASSVCRISTESTAFASSGRNALGAGLSRPSEPATATAAGAGGGEASLLQTVSPFSSCSVRSVCVESSNGTGETASTTATTGAGKADPAGSVRPWELPPKEFLALWRHSRGSVLPGTRSATPPKGATAAENLRITANFE